MAIRVDPDSPIANGQLFDAVYCLSPADTSELIYAGMVFSTKFRADGKTYAGTIIARDWDQAEDIAEARGLAEVVDGRIVEQGEA